MVGRGSTVADTSCSQLIRPTVRSVDGRLPGSPFRFAQDWRPHELRPSPALIPLTPTGAPGRPVDRPVKGPTIDEIVTEYSAAVYRLARSIVRDASLADDAT